MPGIDGLELQRRLRALGIKLPVIIMTGHGDVRLAVEAMKAGAVDFLEKPFDDEILLVAIKAALERHNQLERHEVEIAGVRARLEALTAREHQVLQGLLAGQPNKVMAHALGLSARTVEVHRSNLMTKMGAASLSELVRMVLLAEAAPSAG
jgi:two-component system response regulator FixJ